MRTAAYGCDPLQVLVVCGQAIALLRKARRGALAAATVRLLLLEVHTPRHKPSKRLENRRIIRMVPSELSPDRLVQLIG